MVRFVYIVVQLNCDGEWERLWNGHFATRRDAWRTVIILWRVLEVSVARGAILTVDVRQDIRLF